MKMEMDHGKALNHAEAGEGKKEVSVMGKLVEEIKEVFEEVVEAVEDVVEPILEPILEHSHEKQEAQEQQEEQAAQVAVSGHLAELVERYPVLDSVKEDILAVYEILRDCFASGHKLLVAGNGGSAADADHIVGELMKGFVKRRQIPEEMAQKLWHIDLEAGEELAVKLQGALPAIALTGHSALSTAFLNDVDGKLTYAQQVYGYGVEGDVFLGITTSGNAANVHYASITARAKGMKVVGLTGRDGGLLRVDADTAIIVPEHETYKIQELHLPIYHTLCLMLEEYFF